MKLKSKVRDLEDAPCWNCKHCDSNGKKYPTCIAPSGNHPGQGLYYSHDRGSMTFVRLIGCPKFTERPDMPCYKVTACSRKIKGYCTHEYRDYVDCQDGWPPGAYDKLHGPGANQKRIDDLIELRSNPV